MKWILSNMYIWIFQTGESLHIDKGGYRPMRAINLADSLVDKGHEVLIISSDFFHQRKTKRTGKFSLININSNLNIQLIPSLGYISHKGFMRMFDHFSLAFNLYVFLKKNKLRKPDLAIVGYPPIETAFVLFNWLKSRKVKVILDIKDMWPIRFIDVMPKFFKFIGRIIFHPYFYMAKELFRKVYSISTVSNNYLDWIYQFSNRKVSSQNSLNDFVVPLVRKPIQISEKVDFESNKFWSKKGIDIKLRKHFSFVGTISYCFDFNFLKESSIILSRDFPDVKIVIVGMGDQYKYLKEIFHKFENIYLCGEIDMFNSRCLISHSVATFSPYVNVRNFNDNIPNKIIESIENSTPVLTTLDGAVKELIDKYSFGYKFNLDDDSFYECCKILLTEKELRKKYIQNAGNLYRERFNYLSIYNNFVSKIESFR